jgi:hypothetical protein
MTTTREGTDPAAGTPAPTAEAPPEEQAPEPLTSGLPQLFHLLGTVVAPTTLLTLLLFYFGWAHAYYFYDYFGVNSTLLGLTTRDYVQRAADGLFIPMMAVACAGLLALWAHSLLRARLAQGPIRGCSASSSASRPRAWCWRSAASGACSRPRRCDAVSMAPPLP